MSDTPIANGLQIFLQGLDAEKYAKIKALELENQSLREQLKDTQILERERNETANVFMTQVKKLQVEQLELLNQRNQLLSQNQSLLVDKERLDWLEITNHRPEWLMNLSQDARQVIDSTMKKD